MFGRQAQHGWTFESEGLTEARNRVLYVVEQAASYAHVIAEDGAGRTTLLRLLHNDLHRAGCLVVALNLAAADAESLSVRLAGSLSIPESAAPGQSRRLLKVRDELIGRTACGRRVVILLDDVHRASAEIPDAIQFLVSVAESAQGALTIVTAGDSASTGSLLQRSPLRIHLSALPAAEAQRFLNERLSAIGVPESRLQSSAVRTLLQESRGLPGRLLHICDLISAVCVTQPRTTIDHGVAEALLTQSIHRAA